MDSTPDGARMKVQRAINSLIKNLGGWRPYYDPDNRESDNSESDSELSGVADDS